MTSVMAPEMTWPLLDQGAQGGLYEAGGGVVGAGPGGAPGTAFGTEVSSVRGVICWEAVVCASARGAAWQPH